MLLLRALGRGTVIAVASVGGAILLMLFISLAKISVETVYAHLGLIPAILTGVSFIAFVVGSIISYAHLRWKIF